MAPDSSSSDPDSYQLYSLGDFTLQNGTTIPQAQIAYKTLGDPSNPAIIYPTWYSGLISSNLWLTGSDKTLDPKNYYIIIPALFGNGQSTSPSNWEFKGKQPFPRVSFYDNVRAQHELVTKGLGLKRVYAVLGWSMGAGQTYQWATQFPDFLDVAVPFCGSARTSLHNQVFLEGVKAALLGPKSAVSGGLCEADVEKGGFSQAFYREKLYETVLGFKDLEDFMKNFWEAWALSKDPENMLTMLYTWQSGDVSKQ
ncbi:homoserine acetyltransferase family protein, partial [Venturia nashicola]